MKLSFKSSVLVVSTFLSLPTQLQLRMAKKKRRASLVTEEHDSSQQREPTTAASQSSLSHPKCPHLKTVKVAKIKKAVSSKDSPQRCQTCVEDESRQKKADEEKSIENGQKSENSRIAQTQSDQDTRRGICLICAKIFCFTGLISQQAQPPTIPDDFLTESSVEPSSSVTETDKFLHLKQHFENTSRAHCIFLDLDSLECYCFACERLITPSQNRNQIISDVRSVFAKSTQTKPTILSTVAAEKSDTSSITSRTKDSVDSWSSISQSKSSLPSQISLTSSAREKNATIIAPGLINLGNTCFFNSLMQAFTYTAPFVESIQTTFLSFQDQEAFPDGNDTSMALNQAFYYFVTRMRDHPDPALIPLPSSANTSTSSISSRKSKKKASTQSNAINPRELLGQISQRWAQFRGYNQHDSHELMRLFLDGLRAEQIKYFQSKRTKAKDDGNGDNKPDPSIITNVDKVFGGHLISLIQCDECRTVTKSNEQFLDLSLPTFIGPLRPKAELSRIARDRMRRLRKTKELQEAEESVEYEHVDSADGLFKPWTHLPKSLSQTIEALEDSMYHFTQVETLSGDNAFACEVCYKKKKEDQVARQEKGKLRQQENQSKVEEEEDEDKDEKDVEKSEKSTGEEEERGKYIYRSAKKRYFLSSPMPKTLVIHLKRFQQISGGLHIFRGQLTKISHHVKFSELVDITSFVATDELLSTIKFEQKEPIQEHIQSDPSTIYSLYAVICHSGNLSSGHYIAYVSVPIQLAFALTKPNSPLQVDSEVSSSIKDPSTEIHQWLYFSDSVVRLSNIDEVLKSQAYLLFYQQLPTVVIN